MMFPFDLLGDDARPQAQTQLGSTTWVLSYIGQDGAATCGQILELLKTSDILVAKFQTNLSTILNHILVHTMGDFLPPPSPGGDETPHIPN